MSTPLPTPSARFPRAARVRTRAEFDQVFGSGRRLTHPLLGLHWLADGRPPRLGLAVSRKVDPHAVGRNRIKRALREAFRGLRPALADGAYVLVARAAARNAPPATLRAALLTLLQRAGALPPSAVPGTMPAADRPDSPSSPLPPPHRAG
jgi:ribonuclease P protein component